MELPLQCIAEAPSRRWSGATAEPLTGRRNRRRARGRALHHDQSGHCILAHEGECMLVCVHVPAQYSRGSNCPAKCTCFTRGRGTTRHTRTHTHKAGASAGFSGHPSWHDYSDRSINQASGLTAHHRSSRRRISLRTPLHTSQPESG